MVTTAPSAASQRPRPSRGGSTTARKPPPVRATNGRASEVKHPAAQIGLRFSCDEDGGLRRKRSGRGFRYLDPEGNPIRDPETLSRISALAIPPAWSDVWICALPDGHIQATGRDTRGRKQYRYHPRWQEIRNKTKFGRMAEFGRALPAIRAKVEAGLRLPGLPREKVLAAVVELLDQTHIRVGNEEYARGNNSYGLTTLRDKHAKVEASAVRFRFTGKSGKEHRVQLRDRRLARIVKRSQDLPGQRLFAYEDDDGVVHPIGSADVNAYLREISGGDYTAKDFRTWAGTRIVAAHLRQVPVPESDAEGKRAIIEAVDRVAEELNNTRAVARGSYIHPAVFDAFLAGTLQTVDPNAAPALPDGKLHEEERLVLAVLAV